MDKEAIEKIAKWLYTDYSQVELGQYPYVWGEYEEIPQADKEHWLRKADQVLTLIKEAGYVKIRKGDIYWTREQLSAPDWATKYYIDS